jgi:hypothetical protein
MRKGILVLLLLAGCASQPVTLDGEPVTDPAIVAAANHLYNIETALVLAGNALNAARGSFTDAQWEGVISTGEVARAALFVGRDALVEAQQTHTTSKLDKALVALNIAAKAFLALVPEEA